MTLSASPVPGGTKVMASIGHVCLQWARLEMALLGVISNIESMSTEKTFIMFGGLDIRPRIGMAIQLARYDKLAPPLIKRLSNIRDALKDGIADMRNQVVHGAHRDMEGDTTTLTMVRWTGDKRTQTFTAIEIYQLGEKIFQLGNEAWSIMEDIAEWKLARLARHSQDNLTDTLGDG